MLVWCSQPHVVGRLLPQLQPSVCDVVKSTRGASVPSYQIKHTQCRFKGSVNVTGTVIFKQRLALCVSLLFLAADTVSCLYLHHFLPVSSASLSIKALPFHYCFSFRLWMEQVNLHHRALPLSRESQEKQMCWHMVPETAVGYFTVIISPIKWLFSSIF